jgi:hypothetical protein
MVEGELQSAVGGLDSAFTGQLSWVRIEAGDGRVLDFEPGVFQVEVALDAVHHLVADLTPVPQPHDLAPPRLQQLADQPLVGSERSWEPSSAR